MFGYIHIMAIGKDTEHVITAINDRKFKPIKKIYLLHSPDNPTLKLKKIAMSLKKKLEKVKMDVKLVEINAFEMSSILNEITRIVQTEHGDNPNPLNDIVVNVTGGTNIMAVASMWAAGSHKLSSYYVLNNKFQKNLKSYLVEIATPKYKNLLEDNEKHQRILHVLNKQTFHWPGIPETSEVKMDVKEDIRNSDWTNEQTRKGVATLTRLKGEMEKLGVPPNTTKSRLERMVESGVVMIKHDVPMRSTRGSVDYQRHVYFIDQKAQLVSITDAGKSALIGYKPKK